MAEKALCLLIADDDPDILRMLRTVLSRQFEVVTAADGLEAERLLLTRPFDGIIADQMMPGVEGIELLRRAQKIQPLAVRILITAADRVSTLSDAVNIARVHRFLTKPLRLHELASVVGEAIRMQSLEDENSRLLAEITGRNEELERALAEVRTHEQELEIRVESRTAELRAAMAELEQLALRDGLTGLYNHRYFQEALQRELLRAARYDWSVGLVFLDLDHFKNYNDVNGHQKGDALLREIARILGNTGSETELRHRGRASDVVARYGGEEFVLILPQTDRSGAAIRAERLRELLANHSFHGCATQPLGCLSASFGVAAYPEDASTPHALIEVADQLAMLAKRTGRNQVRVAGEAIGDAPVLIEEAPDRRTGSGPNR